MKFMARLWRSPAFRKVLLTLAGAAAITVVNWVTHQRAPFAFALGTFWALVMMTCFRRGSGG